MTFMVLSEMQIRRKEGLTARKEERSFRTKQCLNQQLEMLLLEVSGP